VAPMSTGGSVWLETGQHTAMDKDKGNTAKRTHGDRDKNFMVIDVEGDRTGQDRKQDGE
jgi:hypothetical protein